METHSHSGAPFFSIVLPTYNRALLITRAIESVQAQTFSDWELVVVDDGSDDNSREVVIGIARNDDRIKLVQQSHAGAAAARNYGVEVSVGRFITFVDSDDEYLPAHLQMRFELLQEDPRIDMLHGGVEIIGDPYVPDMNDIGKRIHIGECKVGGTFVLRRELLRHVGGFPLVDYGEDALLYERCVAHGANIQVCTAGTYRYYRTSPDTTCATILESGGQGVATREIETSRV